MLVAVCLNTCPGLPLSSLEGWGSLLNLCLSFLAWEIRVLPRVFVRNLSRGEVCPAQPVCAGGVGAAVLSTATYVTSSLTVSAA